MPLSTTNPETASIASTSTFSSTISLLKKLKPSTTTQPSYSASPRPSPYKTSYPSTSPNYPRWGPKSDLSSDSKKSKSKSNSKSKAESKSKSSEKYSSLDDDDEQTMNVGIGAGAMSFSPYRASYPTVEPKSNEKKESNSKSEAKSQTTSKSPKENRLIFEIGSGAGATTFAPYHSAYASEFKTAFPRMEDVVDGEGEMGETREERRKREKREVRDERKMREERNRQERKVMREERVRMDREIVKFPYTAASLMRV